ncbi:hypothetical protein LCGC14_1695730, partial [marine sediment metagenome]
MRSYTDRGPDAQQDGDRSRYVVGLERTAWYQDGELQADETVPQYIKRLKEAKAALEDLEQEEKDVSDAALILRDRLTDAFSSPFGGSVVLKFLEDLATARGAIESLATASNRISDAVNRTATEMANAAKAGRALSDSYRENFDQLDLLLGLVDEAG